MNTAQPQQPESWILLKPGYSYLALPSSVALQVLNQAKLVDSEYVSGTSEYRYSMSEKPMELKMMTNDQMTVMQVRDKMLQK